MEITFGNWVEMMIWAVMRRLLNLSQENQEERWFKQRLNKSTKIDLKIVKPQIMISDELGIRDKVRNKKRRRNIRKCKTVNIGLRDKVTWSANYTIACN